MVQINKNKTKVVMILIVLMLTVVGCAVDTPVVDVPLVEDPIVLDDPSVVNQRYTMDEIEAMYGSEQMFMDVIKEFIWKEIPDLDLIDRDGNEVNLKELYLGKPFIVEFMGTWCPVCERTLPTANAFNEKSDIPYIFISGDQSIEEMKEFMGESNTPYYVGKDNKQFNDNYPLSFVPATLFVDSDGIVQMFGVGELSEEFIESIVMRSF